MSLADDKADNLAGFAIWRTVAGKPEQALANRLNFTAGVFNETTAADHKWTPSDQAPFQKFRWVDVPPDGFTAPITYRVRALISPGKARPAGGPDVSITVKPATQRHARFHPGFTRGYIASQAYADKFHNKDIRPAGAHTPTFDTKPFQAQYQWLGADARTKLLDFIADCEHDGRRKVSVFAYDLDEPDVIDAICELGQQQRLKAILETRRCTRGRQARRGAVEVAAAQDDHRRGGHGQREAGHTSSGTSTTRCSSSAIASGKAQKVLFGSMNFSVRGIYVQANNVIVVDDPTTAGMFAQAFDEAFKDGVKAPPFRANSDLGK